MQTIWLVARREIISLLRRPSFYATMLMPPLLAAVMIFGLSFLNRELGDETASSSVQSTQPEPVGYVDQAEIIRTVPAQLEPLLAPFTSEAEAAAALRDGTIGSYFLVGADYLATGNVTRVSEQVTFTGGEAADSRIFQAVLTANLAGDPVLAERLQQPAQVETSIIREDQGPAEVETSNEGLSALLAILLAFAIITGGGWLVQAVAEEKENRTIEVVLTSVRPLHLMAGKLIGLGVIALGQMCVWIAVVRASGGAAQSFGGVDIAGVPITTWLWMLVFFLLGFLFYGGIMTAIAAVGASAREAGQVTGLLALPIIAPIWFMGVVVENPDGMLSRVMSLLPFTSPVTMMLRLGQGDVPAWQLLLSAALLAASVLLVIWLAARLFRSTTLLAGVRPSPAALWQALRQA